MNSLYSAVACLDHNILGSPRTTNWQEWVGTDTDTICGNCKSPVLTTDYFCHYCGRGVKPKPCLHPPAPDSNSHLLPVSIEIEPQLIVYDQGEFRLMKIQCPICGKTTSGQPRSYFACAEWNALCQYMKGVGHEPAK